MPSRVNDEERAQRTKKMFGYSGEILMRPGI